MSQLTPGNEHDPGSPALFYDSRSRALHPPRSFWGKLAKMDTTPRVAFQAWPLRGDPASVKAVIPSPFSLWHTWPCVAPGPRGISWNPSLLLPLSKAQGGRVSTKRGNAIHPIPTPTPPPSVLLLVTSFFEHISPLIAARRGWALPCLSCLLGRISQSFCRRGFVNADWGERWVGPVGG